jgi:glycosyltransferase involved in cell wall biosynthesis
LQNDPDIRFLFVGEGPVKADIIALSKEYGLPNVVFRPEVPRDQMPAHLSAADVALVPLRRLDLFKGALPSKMFDAWAAGCPTLVSIEGEAQRVVEQSGAGLFVKPENPQALAEAIQGLSRDRGICHEMGSRGRTFVNTFFSRQAQAQQLERVLHAAIG